MATLIVTRCSYLSLSRLDVESYGRHVPSHALGDHRRGRLQVLFKMCRSAMCLQGGCVVVDFVEEHMVRVAVLEQHVELPAARLLYACCCVLQNCDFEFLVFGRHDVEFDRIDVWRKH